MLNKIILMGRLVADPELRQTPNGVSVATFRLAVERNYQGQDGQRQADFIPCVAWRQTGEFISRYFAKGGMIALEGSLQTRNYEDKTGAKRTAYEVIVDHAFFAGGSKASDDRPDYYTQQPQQQPKRQQASPSSGYSNNPAGQINDRYKAAQSQTDYQQQSFYNMDVQYDDGDLPF